MIESINNTVVEAVGDIPEGYRGVVAQVVSALRAREQAIVDNLLAIASDSLGQPEDFVRPLLREAGLQFSDPEPEPLIENPYEEPAPQDHPLMQRVSVLEAGINALGEKIDRAIAALAR